MFQSSSITEGQAPEPTDARIGAEDRRLLTVLQVIPRMETGAAEREVLEITEAVTREGGRAIVAVAGGRMLPRITKAGGEVIAMNLDTGNLLNLWQNARLLARLIRDLEVDIVHARARATAWSAYWAARRTGARFITTYHPAWDVRGFMARRADAALAKGQPVIAVSDFVRGQIMERHGLTEDRIVTIPRGADINVFSEETVGNERAVKLAQSWGLLDDARPVVLLPSALTRDGGAEDVIEAAARLREVRGGEFLVLLAGDDAEGAREPALRRKIDARGVGDLVRLVGPCTDAAAAYKLASVVVSAARAPEAFGQPIVEAQAMGRPVIVTDHGALRETVRHGESGWLYPPGDVARLAVELNKALNLDPSERAHLGMAARARIHARYTVSAMQRATLDVYEQAAGRTFATLV